jgi:muramoyltetrapeptide carboxypeptidase
MFPLLEYLDYELIKNHPKIFMGYSDITALHLGIYAKTGLTTFLGPAILPQFGEFGGLYPFTKRYMTELLMEGKIVTDQASEEWIYERLMWGEKDNRKRTAHPNEGMIVLKEGSATGPIISGNVGTMLLLAGTSYFPSV